MGMKGNSCVSRLDVGLAYSQAAGQLARPVSAGNPTDVSVSLALDLIGC
jgi:hypothetical protein